MVCDVKLSDEPTRIVGLQNLKNTCYANYALYEQRTFRIRGFLQIVCLRIAVLLILASIIFPTVK